MQKLKKDLKKVVDNFEKEVYTFPPVFAVANPPAGLTIMLITAQFSGNQLIYKTLVIWSSAHCECYYLESLLDTIGE